MKRALNILALAAGVVVLIVVVKVVLLWLDPGDDVYKPRGYERIAQVFLRHGWITIDNDGQAALSGAADKNAKDVFHRSFLAQDVEEFNAGQSSIFRVQNQQVVSLDTTRHNVVLPYSDLASWRGALRYRSSGTLEASLRGIGVDIRVDTLTQNLLDQVQPKTVTIRGNLQPDPVNRARGEVVSIYGEPKV